MAFPEPQRGLVISYSYLWHHEHAAGQQEGRKIRPCVIIVSVQRHADDSTLVRVVPVTHTRPDNMAIALELPHGVKRHLGLDDARSWVILNEVNEFVWPGFDLRPIPGSRHRYDYGLLPPRLFDQLMVRLRGVWTASRGAATPRD